MARITCGDLSRLKRLLDESLPAEEQTALEAHLDGCEICCQALEDLAADPDWWERLRRAGISGDAKAPGHPAPAEPARLDFLRPPAGPDHIGRLGPYDVIGTLGQGGMGLVLKGFDPSLSREVAIKVLAPALAASAPARQRFLHEARAAASINHPHVVTIYAVDEDGGVPYLVMEYVAGRSLQGRLDDPASGPLTLNQVLRIAMQTALELAAAHGQGLVHRDVKPSNILLENGLGRVKITDFGLARTAEDAGLTRSGVVAGTPPYMAPEQARGEPVDHRADLFGLGGVIYAMAAGHPPFRAGSTMAVLRRVCQEQPRPLREVNPEVPEGLALVVDRLLAKDPAERFASADEVADRLRALLTSRAAGSPSGRPYDC
jgi:serine/threonine protein kinase